MLWLLRALSEDEATKQTRADCRRLMDGKVDARTLAAEILARRRAQLY